MRFSLLTLTAIVLLLVAQVLGETLVELKTNHIAMVRRADNPMAAAGSATNATASSQAGHGAGHGTATDGNTTAKPSPSAPVARKRAPTLWASPQILQDGTLFYIAISISTLLWCTGKGINMTLDQQERKAEYAAQR